MRLAVLSDIHGNLIALEAVLRDLQAAGGADKTWVLGDLVALGPRPVEVLQKVRDLPNAEVISGNTDRYSITGQRSTVRAKDEAGWQQAIETMRQRDTTYQWIASKLSFADYEYLAKLRPELSLEVPGYGWAIGYHAAPGDDERVMLPDTPDYEVLDQLLDREGRLAFGGHTHLPMDRDLGRWRVVNVGSIGMPFDAPQACYALVTFDQGTANVELRRVAFDLAALEADAHQQGLPSVDELMSRIGSAGKQQANGNGKAS